MVKLYLQKIKVRFVRPQFVTSKLAVTAFILDASKAKNRIEFFPVNSLTL